MGALNVKLGHLVDRGQPQETFVLRSGVAGAACMIWTGWKQEEVALSTGLAIHVRAVQEDGGLGRAALVIVRDLILHAPLFSARALLPTDQHRTAVGEVLYACFSRGHTEVCFLTVNIEERLC